VTTEIALTDVTSGPARAVVVIGEAFFTSAINA
jgi:hypothetical protein